MDMSITSPPTLEQSLENLLFAIKRCITEKDIDSAALACSASRTAWSAYYDVWLVTAKHKLKEYSVSLENYLGDCIEVVKHITADPSNEEDVLRLRKYKENIAFRYNLLKILHKSGVEGVERALTEGIK